MSGSAAHPPVPVIDSKLLDFAEAEGHRAEAAVTAALVALQREANTLLSIQLLFLAAALGHTVDRLSSAGVTVFFVAGAGLTLWLGLLAASTVSNCLRASDWMPEGTEPNRLLVEGLTTDEVRLDQLDNATEKIQANKARVVSLAGSLNRHRAWTVASPLGYLAGTGIGWLVLG